MTMPAETVRAVSTRVGSREFSAYVAAATAEQLRRDAIRETLAQMKVEHGEVDAGALERAMEAFQL